VLISAGAKVLGNIVVGEGAKIAAGSVVLNDVAPRSTVAGVPAKRVGQLSAEMPALNMDQNIGEEL
jgi:serine O-acetyltransferase